MGVAGVILGILLVIIVIGIIYYAYHRYSMTSNTISRDIDKTRKAVMNAKDAVTEAFTEDGQDGQGDDTVSNAPGTTRPTYSNAIPARQGYDKTVRVPVNKGIGYGVPSSVSTTVTRPILTSTTTTVQGGNGIAATTGQLIDNVKTALEDIDYEMSNLDGLPGSCIQPAHLKMAKQKLMDGKQHISEAIKSCGIGKNGKNGVQKQPLPNRTRNAYPTRTQRPAVDQDQYDDSEVDEYDCDQFEYDQGDYCIQDIPGQGKACFLSGNDKKGTKGWYEKADMSMCRNRPSCGDVMLKCQGYNPIPADRSRAY